MFGLKARLHRAQDRPPIRLLAYREHCQENDLFKGAEQDCHVYNVGTELQICLVAFFAIVQMPSGDAFEASLCAVSTPR